MTPEECRDKAQELKNLHYVEDATYYATMGILEALLEMEICEHGTRGFCKDCVRNDFLSYPILVRNADK